MQSTNKIEKSFICLFIYEISRNMSSNVWQQHRNQSFSVFLIDIYLTRSKSYRDKLIGLCWRRNKLTQGLQNCKRWLIDAKSNLQCIKKIVEKWYMRKNNLSHSVNMKYLLEFTKNYFAAINWFNIERSMIYYFRNA